jgi:very-short-patch-repair endonuclease
MRLHVHGSRQITVGRIVLEAPSAHIRLVAGLSAPQLRAILDETDIAAGGRLALLIEPGEIGSGETLIEHFIAHLSSAASELWPIWYTHEDFSAYKDDALGREAIKLRLAEVARDLPTLSLPWARAAAMLAMRGAPPRPAETLWPIEIAQLCLAINRSGLVIVFDLGDLPEPSRAFGLVHALEMIAGRADVPVVVLCAALPAFEPPYDRILIDAVAVEDCLPPTRCGFDAQPKDAPRPTFLAPILGRPHPLSEVERRVARALETDAQLRCLFHYNQPIETIRGSRPRVDLLWPEGLLVVELDGYADHSRPEAFAADRHRDYELALSGYTVLRLANEEVLRDVEKAVEKIRDMVELRRQQTGGSART